MSAGGWQLDEDALRRHGEAIALEGVRPALSYRLLAGRARAAADALEDAGIRPGDRVAILSRGRGHDEPVAVAAVALVGAVAVPLDPRSPPLRLGAIARGCGCRAQVCDPAAAGALDEVALEGARVELDEDGFVLASRGAAAPDMEPASGGADAAPACILHTSGSTGTPKPIAIGWAAHDVFTGWMIELLGLGPGDRVPRTAELVFDLAWFDHLASWRAGATLCTMARRELLGGRALLAAWRRLRPDVVYAVPALLMRLVDALDGAVLEPAPRVICFAGEAYPPRELIRLAAAAPEAELYNLFGPTETNVCTFHRVERAALGPDRPLPIGRPCPYADCELVCADGAVIDGPGVGELVVRGPTALGGLVHTGDRVERDESGLLHTRGRLDRMVKIHGFRIEPGEVEAALTAHPAVREAAVKPADGPRLGRTLWAWVVLRADAAPAPSALALRRYLAKRLAPAMVPERVEIASALPRTTTGKIDYAALG